MARYFKLVEIDRDSFIEATGDDLDCLQVVDVCEGVGYVAIADTETEMIIDLDVLRRNDYVYLAHKSHHRAGACKSQPCYRCHLCRGQEHRLFLWW